MIGLEVLGGVMPPDLLALLGEAEASIVAEVSARPETVSMIIRDGVKLLGYAVYGLDDGGKMVIVYAARSFSSFVAKAAMTGIFGAAQVLGVPMRVHTDKLRSMARMMGASQVVAALDGDGLRVGVFDGV